MSSSRRVVQLSMLTLLLAMAFDCRVEGQERAPKTPPQTPRASPQPEEEEVIRISTALVTVPVTRIRPPHVIVRSRASYVCCGAVGSPGNP